MEKDPELYNAKIGLEVEFVRKNNFNVGTIKKQLSRLLKVKMNIEKEHHSDFVPTDEHFKLEPDFSGGEYTVELVTGPMDYNHAKIVLMKVLKWIRDTKEVKTTERCGLHINLNFPNTRYIQDIDILKFILNFDEREVYDRFPKREDNLYTKSIKDIIPLHNNFDFKTLTTNRTSFVYPSTKYYGINFEKLKSSYLEFRYLGGRKYEEQQSDILYLIDYFLMSIKNSYHANDDNIKEKLIDLLEPKKNVFLAGQNYFNFHNIFRNIEIKVDTKNDEETLKLFFPIIWREIFPILIRMRNIKYNMAGTINYDTDNSFIEFSGFTLRRTLIENPGILLYDCRLINMVLINPEIHDCIISNSDLDGCKSENTKFKNSRIKNSNNVYGEFKNCYLDGVKLVYSYVDGGIFRKGSHTQTEITDSTAVIKVDVEDLDANLENN
tara:strand:- start:297 stop:1607 length:1311 start_codon:yes stop_codon:yes gene_type:complete